MDDHSSTLDRLVPDSDLSPPPRSVSARGILVGGAVGLSSGLLLDYLALLGLRLLQLPSPGPALADLMASNWINPVLILTTVLGIIYYGRES